MRENGAHTPKEKGEEVIVTARDFYIIDRFV